ncbi:DNA polymerase epsilon catalytic subunit [Vairimorpha necatrix]|uniref:DNA polymerase epsilon catalytic subunit n=1 Tax=Vairimorpha necatrix TaxID=6039 RepID=A0AAX4JDZ1_9MICR
MREIIEELETQFKFQEYLLQEIIEGYIFNFDHVINEDSSSYVRIYFVTKDLRNFYITVPFYYSMLIECINQTDVEEYIKNQYPEGYVSSNIVEKYDSTEYNYLNKEKKKLLKINYKYKNTFDRLLKDIKKAILNNRNNKKIESVYKDMMKYKKEEENNIVEYLLNIYEYDIPPEIIISDTYKVRAGKWYEYSYNGEEYNINLSQKTETPDLRVFAFDIKTHDKYPDSSNDEIVSIAIKTDTANMLIINRSIILQDIGTFEYEPTEELCCQFTSYNMDSEEELILKFLELFQIYKPHIVSTFRGNTFDFSYLETRMIKHKINLTNMTGFTREREYYTCPFILHFDCHKWAIKDDTLSEVSHDLKSITKMKLEYEIESEDMLNEKMLSDFVEDVVATFYLSVKYVQPQIFCLSSLIPYTPIKALTKKPEVLCEALLIIEAFQHSFLIPNKKIKEIHEDKAIDFVTNSFECLKSGIFRSDFEYQFILNEQELKNISESLDDILVNISDSDISLIKKEIKTKLMNIRKYSVCKGNIYHIDFKMLYSDIILTNNLQPVSLVNDDICIRCDYFPERSKCNKKIEIDNFNEIEQRTIKEYNQDPHPSKRYQNEDANQAEENRVVNICQRAIPFFIESIRKIREKDNLTNILKSFYSYLTFRNARWSSPEMSSVVSNLADKIIQECKEVLDKISTILEINPEGIWILVPEIFPSEILVGNLKINFLNLYLNHMNSKKHNIDSFYNINGPYNGMIIPFGLDKSKKKYLIINFDDSMGENKLDLKEYNNLEILKRIQDELFEEYTQGNTLQDCYDKLASVCRYWLKLLESKCQALSDDEILEMFSETKEVENNSKLTKKLAEFKNIEDFKYFEDVVVKYFVSVFPTNEPLSNRRIPSLIYKSKEADFFLKKWTQFAPSLEIRDLIDWDYYSKIIKDYLSKMIILPALDQKIENPLPEIKIQKPAIKQSTKSDLLDYFVVKKKTQDSNKPEITTESKKIKEQNGILKIVKSDKNYIFYFYNKINNPVENKPVKGKSLLKPEIEVKQSEVNQIFNSISKLIEMKIYFKANKIFCIENKVKFTEKYLPESKNLEKISYISTSSSDYYLKLVNNPNISEIYNFNVPSIFQSEFDKYEISRNPNFVILTSFNFGKFIIFAFSKNEKFTFISNFKHSLVENINLQNFILKNVDCLILLNGNDKNYEDLKKVCLSYVYNSEKIQIKKRLCSFPELLEIQKNLHRELKMTFETKSSICSYLGIPVCNNDIPFLDYLYYKSSVDFNALVSEGGPESHRLFKNEKVNPRFYKHHSIQFECVGSLILSILENEVLFDESDRLDFRPDFKVLFNMVNKIFKDYKMSIPGSNLILNRIEKWIRKESSFLSTSLKDLINLLHQRYIFNLISFFNDLKMNIIYVSANIFCIETEKDTSESAEKIFEYCKKIISKKKGYRNLVFRKSRHFDKLLFIDPNNFFYMKNQDQFCTSDLKVPAEFIRKYFTEDNFTGEYIYNLVTSVDREVADLILISLRFKPEMYNVISNCKKLLKIDEYSKNEENIEMLIICRKCNLENVMRSRCIKCMYRFVREEVYEVVEKYFRHYLNLELSDELFCEKCGRINERKLTEYCECGGIFKKRSYVREIEKILSKLNNEDLTNKFKTKLDFYNIKIRH